MIKITKLKYCKYFSFIIELMINPRQFNRPETNELFMNVQFQENRENK